MSIELMLYLFNVCDSAAVACFIILLFWFMFKLFGFFHFLSDWSWVRNDDEPEAIKNLKYFIFSRGWIPIVCLLFMVITPSQKTFYSILAIHYGKEVATSEIGNKAYKLLNQKLDEYLEGDK
jgi:hypothetical protein